MFLLALIVPAMRIVLTRQTKAAGNRRRPFTSNVRLYSPGAQDLIHTHGRGSINSLINSEESKNLRRRFTNPVRE
jgi:hypothetical protein